MMTRSSLPRILVPVLVLLVLLQAGCGRKMWPKPQAWQDTFSWESATARKVGDCMIIDAKLKGAWENMESVVLQIEPVGPEDDCLTCPFVPRSYVELSSPSPELGQDGPRLTINRCGLGEGRYRWRLMARNRFTTIPPQLTEVQLYP